MFLMHRVELKERKRKRRRIEGSVVPNAPCGVERLYGLSLGYSSMRVPNAPCGVERTGLRTYLG